MSKDLIMDQSKEIFKIDKDVLSFRINYSNLSKLSSLSSSSSKQLQPLSEEQILITNLTSEYLAFRTKTTKKELYIVNPTFCIISPNGTQVLNFIFHNKPGDKLDPKNHKFKFQGFIIPESKKDLDTKELIKEYIQKGEKVVGNEKKCHVKFLEENDNSILSGSINNLGNSNMSNYTVANDQNQGSLLKDKIENKEEENLRLSDIIQDKSGGRFGMENNKEKLEILKREHNQLKEQYENLKRNEELLNKRIDNEKNQKSSSGGYSTKFNYKVPVMKEPKLSRNKLIGIFLLSILVGFYLVK